jgi:hypothetical protein
VVCKQVFGWNIDNIFGPKAAKGRIHNVDIGTSGGLPQVEEGQVVPGRIHYGQVAAHPGRPRGFRGTIFYAQRAGKIFFLFS